MIYFIVFQYCGPFYVSRIYWADAGKPIFKDDTLDRALAFNDCASDYNCASKIVTNYMVKYGKDCNNDGITDCNDYAAIHVNGGPACSTSLQATSYGRDFLKRYNKCNLH